MSIKEERSAWDKVPFGTLIPPRFCNNFWFTKVHEDLYDDHRCFRQTNHKGRCMCGTCDRNVTAKKPNHPILSSKVWLTEKSSSSAATEKADTARAQH